MNNILLSLILFFLIISNFSCAYEDLKEVKGRKTVLNSEIEFRKISYNETSAEEIQETSKTISSTKTYKSRIRNAIRKNCCTVIGLSTYFFLINHIHLYSHCCGKDTNHITKFSSDFNSNTYSNSYYALEQGDFETESDEYYEFLYGNSTDSNTSISPTRYHWPPPLFETEITTTLDKETVPNEGKDWIQFLRDNDDILYFSTITLILIGWMIFCLIFYIKKKKKEMKEAKERALYITHVEII